MIQCRKSNGELPSDQAIPVCSTSVTQIAAYDLLVALCTGCVHNLRLAAQMLTDMYYAGKIQIIISKVYYAGKIQIMSRKCYIMTCCML